MNEYTCANKTFADVFENAVGATARSLDTGRKAWLPLYTILFRSSALTLPRRVSHVPRARRVCARTDGKEVLAQVVGYDNGEATVILPLPCLR